MSLPEETIAYYSITYFLTYKGPITFYGRLFATLLFCFGVSVSVCHYQKGSTGKKMLGDTTP
jgi:hypothetical protein